MNSNTLNSTIQSSGRLPGKPLYVFLSLWCVLFLLYLPAVNGGWVSDTTEWLQKIKTQSFRDFVNVQQSRGSVYQFTQVVTFFLFKLFGSNPWPWHLVFITMQAINSTLLYIICKKLFDESGVKNSFAIAAGGVLLFCTCPHISEVIVWKASYHYLQALLMMLAILYCVQQFHYRFRLIYPLIAAIIFLLSSFAHEFFYLSPLFVLTVIIYYRIVLAYDRIIYKKALLYFVLPMFIILLSHFILIRVVSGHFTADLGDEVHQPLSGYLRKPPLYLFHTVFFGRFFSHDTRQKIYDFAVANKGIALVYGLLACVWVYIIFRFRQMTPASKAVVLIFSWLHICIAIVCPVWFPQTLLVNFDRYAYFMLPFIYLLFMFLLVNIKIKEWGITFFIVYAFINVYFTVQVNNYWKQSARVVDHLVHNVPSIDNNKIVLLLNVPGNMNGVPMIGPFLHFSFRQMYNLYNERQINNTTYDVVSYNMSGPNDGAHVNVYNDSLMHVTLNQWGTWWWYGMWGAFSYENEYYKLNMIDLGHWYELILKRPASEYMLLYNVGDQWKVVDWNKKNDDQN